MYTMAIAIISIGAFPGVPRFTQLIVDFFDRREAQLGLSSTYLRIVSLEPLVGPLGGHTFSE